MNYRKALSTCALLTAGVLLGGVSVNAVYTAPSMEDIFKSLPKKPTTQQKFGNMPGKLPLYHMLTHWIGSYEADGHIWQTDLALLSTLEDAPTVLPASVPAKFGSWKCSGGDGLLPQPGTNNRFLGCKAEFSDYDYIRANLRIQSDLPLTYDPATNTWK